MPLTTSTVMPCAPAEDERVAALESHDGLALQRLGSHQLVDEGLRCALAAATLADMHDACGRCGEGQHLVADQVVHEQHRRAADRAHRFQRQQFRVTGPGADQRDLADHAVCSVVAERWIAPSAATKHSTWPLNGPGAGFSPLTTAWM
jgi:hypothetical protein